MPLLVTLPGVTVQLVAFILDQLSVAEPPLGTFVLDETNVGLPGALAAAETVTDVVLDVDCPALF